MIKISIAFSKSNIILLAVLYIGVIIFFYYINFTHTLNDLLNSIIVATKIFLVPSIIGILFLKWTFEVILTLFNCKSDNV